MFLHIKVKGAAVSRLRLSNIILKYFDNFICNRENIYSVQMLKAVFVDEY